MGVRELRAAAAEDARGRLEDISRRSGEVADMMDSFLRARTAQAASDAREQRAKAERARRTEAAAEARARMAEFHELDAIWRGTPR